MGSFLHDEVAWKWTQEGVLWADGTWERGQEDASFWQVDRKKREQMARRSGM